MANPLAKYKDRGNPLEQYKERVNPLAGLERENPLEQFKETPVETEEKLTPLFQPTSPEAKTMAQFATNLINSAGFDIPGFVAKKAGYSLPQPETPSERVAAGLGSLGGYIALPAKVGGKVATKLFNRVLKNPTLLKATGMVMGKTATSLGIASGLMTPQEGFFAPVQRLKQFGNGAVQGLVFGGLSFIPSKTMRMTLNSAAVGLPATLTHQPLEMQIFNYGLGAYFGVRGLSAKGELEKQQALSNLVKNGLPTPDAQRALQTNQKFLNDLDTTVAKKGKTPFTVQDRINAIVGKNVRSQMNFRQDGSSIYKGVLGKEYYTKDYRNPLVKRVLGKAQAFKKDSKRHLRFDDVDFILTNYGTRKKLEKLTDMQLEALEIVLNNPPRTPSVSEFQPERPKGAVGIYDRIFRPNYSVLKKMGLGNAFRSGLTNELVNNDIQHAVNMSNHMKLVDNWKRVTGMRPDTRDAIALYLDGVIGKKQLVKFHGQKSLTVANQMRQYFDILLNGINRQRAKYNQPLIERQENYLTHIFESLVKEARTTKDTSNRLPFELEQAIDFITPKRRTFLFEKKRVSRRNDYSTDLWKILDIYSTRASLAMNDSFIRKSRRFITYLEKEAKLRADKDQTFDYDVSDLLTNLKRTVKEVTGRPLLLDRAISNTMQSWNKWASQMGYPGMQIDSLSKLSNALTSMVYSTQMAFRPKLAIRNLGQHSLIIGQTGYKPLLKALTAKRTPELLEILSKSKVIKSRATAFAPEAETLSKFIKSGMWMFQKADMKNVVDAYLAGYFQAGGGKKGVIRGDEVAGLTQFLYLNGNRNGLGRGLGLSRTLRPLSIFTTWPTNYVEFLVASARPENRANLLKYLATSTGFIGLTALAGIRGIEYTGLKSPLSLWQWVTKGQFPIFGIAERPRVQIFREIKGLLDGDKDLKDTLFYTFQEE